MKVRSMSSRLKNDFNLILRSGGRRCSMTDRWSRECNSRFGILIIIIREGNTKIRLEDGGICGFFA